MLESGRETFYQVDNGIKSFWCPLKNHAVNTKNNSKVFNIIIHKTKNLIPKKRP